MASRRAWLLVRPYSFRPRPSSSFRGTSGRGSATLSTASLTLVRAGLRSLTLFARGAEAPHRAVTSHRCSASSLWSPLHQGTTARGLRPGGTRGSNLGSIAACMSCWARDARRGGALKATASRARSCVPSLRLSWKRATLTLRSRRLGSSRSSCAHPDAGGEAAGVASAPFPRHIRRLLRLPGGAARLARAGASGNGANASHRPSDAPQPARATQPDAAASSVWSPAGPSLRGIRRRPGPPLLRPRCSPRMMACVLSKVARGLPDKTSSGRPRVRRRA